MTLRSAHSQLVCYILTALIDGVRAAKIKKEPVRPNEKTHRNLRPYHGRKLLYAFCGAGV